MAECDEPSWLAALSLTNSGMEADDGSNKTFVAVMGPINGDCGKNARLQVGPGELTAIQTFGEFGSTKFPYCRQYEKDQTLN